jgi:hypothetical protein
MPLSAENAGHSGGYERLADSGIRACEEEALHRFLQQPGAPARMEGYVLAGATGW